MDATTGLPAPEAYTEKLDWMTCAHCGVPSLRDPRTSLVRHGDPVCERART